MANVDTSSIMVQEELAGAGPYINSQAETMSGELAALVRQLAPIAETWTGPAASYYQPLQQEWNAAADGLFGPAGVLGEIARALNVTWGNYCNAEGANVSTWQIS